MAPRIRVPQIARLTAQIKTKRRSIGMALLHHWREHAKTEGAGCVNYLTLSSNNLAPGRGTPWSGWATAKRNTAIVPDTKTAGYALRLTCPTGSAGRGDGPRCNAAHLLWIDDNPRERHGNSSRCRRDFRNASTSPSEASGRDATHRWRRALPRSGDRRRCAELRSRGQVQRGSPGPCQPLQNRFLRWCVARMRAATCAAIIDCASRLRKPIQFDLAFSI